ncbi:MAG: ribosome maturation factor RimP [Clostridia bacterium]|nr:ribosome maturation factor RimP [Clostridia bacterium]MCR5693572.1 ribosome maturation factor RimP [Clostridia bacterium]
MAEGKTAAIVREAVTETVESMGYELVDVEYVKEGPNWYLRLYIDKEGGVFIDDCVAVNDATEPIIDRLDPIENAYIFEVSSPGIDRPIKTDRDYKRAEGKKIELTLYAQLNGSKQFTGVLKGKKDGKVVIEDNGRTVEIDEKNIAGAKPVIEF